MTAWHQAIRKCLELLWICRTRGRPCQTFWQSRGVVNTGPINLSLGEVPDFCEIRLFEYGPLELRPAKVAAVKLRPTKVGILKLRHAKVGALKLRLAKVGPLKLACTQDSCSCPAQHEHNHVLYRIMSSKVGERIHGGNFMGCYST